MIDWPSIDWPSNDTIETVIVVLCLLCLAYGVWRLTELEFRKADAHEVERLKSRVERLERALNKQRGYK